MPDSPAAAPCPCHSPEARYDRFRTWRTLPRDETEGRFAEVEILQCQQCAQLWLRYAVEYEAFSQSGRWARGQIDEAVAQEMKSEAAADFLAGLPGYVFGGSWFGKAGIGSGAMRWGI